MKRLTVLQGDITRLALDAIVNAANPSLLGGGGVDGAIHRAAGPALLEYCRSLGGCPTGQARLSPGFLLPARYVIHTVGPVWHGGTQGEAELLSSCYQSCFALARQHALERMAFPAISCGVYAFPHQAAVDIALRESVHALRSDVQLKQLVLVAFDPDMAELYRTGLGRITGLAEASAL